MNIAEALKTIAELEERIHDAVKSLNLKVLKYSELKIEYEADYVTITIHTYNQGDVLPETLACVVINPDKLETEESIKTEIEIVLEDKKRKQEEYEAQQQRKYEEQERKDYERLKEKFERKKEK